MVGPIPALLILLSFVVVYFYPITRERHQEIRRMIKERNKAKKAEAAEAEAEAAGAGTGTDAVAGGLPAS